MALDISHLLQNELKAYLTAKSTGNENDVLWPFIEVIKQQQAMGELEEHLRSEIGLNYPPNYIGDLIACLYWSDLEAEASELHESFLESENPQLIRYGLSVTGVFPYRSEIKRLNVLGNIARNHPQLASQALEILTRYNSQVNSR